MLIKGRGGPIELTQSAPENFCRPAVDPMLRSISAAYGPAMLAVILTGMGSDGCEGARVVAAGGGTILAQDEATSVVWGMPAAVAQAGLASAILPLNAVGAGNSQISGYGQMTPADFDFVAQMLKRRSGLVIGPDKAYLLDSRLAPVARQLQLANIDAIVAKVKAGDEAVCRSRHRSDDDERNVFLSR